MESIDFTEEDLRDELAQYYPVFAERRPGGITQDDAAKAWNCDKRTAGNRLNALVEQGIYTRERNICDDGLKRFVYYKK